MNTNERAASRVRRHERVRKTVIGTASRPRLAVYRSLHHIYAQVINDDAGHTLVAASSLDPEMRSQGQGMTKTDLAKAVGKLVAQRARAAGIESIVFDRGGFPYHGRVKALAEGARETGLKF